MLKLPILRSQTPLSFGFELELVAGAQELAENLCQLSLMGDRGENLIHPYHCDCESCDIRVDGVLNYSPDVWPLRMQYDSTCSGEVISAPFNNWDHFEDVIDQLSEAMIKIDAEPGLSAGLHVHVGTAGTLYNSRGSFGSNVYAHLVMALYEPAISALATGRWSYLRTMNNSTARNISLYFNLTHQPEWSTNPQYTLAKYLHGLLETSLEETIDNPLLRILGHNYAGILTDCDRHQNFNPRPLSTKRTYEFRVWNSTRSAWRINLAARASVALRNPLVLNDLMEYVMTYHSDPTFFTTEAMLDNLDAILSRHTQELDGGKLSALIDRQRLYLKKRDGTDPPSLTTIIKGDI